MALDLGGNKKKQNAKSKYSIVELSLFKPGKKKYAEFDYEEIRKKQLNEDDSSGDDERFHDREALEIVKRLEAKYGGKKDKKGRKLCFGTEDDYMDKRAGYDLDDDFIDDSEAYDELIPSTMDTVQGGFYVNRGKLEFKTKHEEVNDSDISDSDDTPQPKKGTKRSQTLSEDDVEVDEDVVPPVAGSATDDKTVSDTPVSIPTNPKPRMVGAPPSKVRRVALGESANQRAANAIKKRLVGMPPTILKRKVLPKLTSRKESEVPAFPRTISGEAIVPKINDKVETETASSSITNKSPEKSAADVLTSTGTCNSTSSPQNAGESATNDTSSSNAGIAPSPKKRPLAPMTDTLSNMIAEFKRCTNNLALPGQKKRLQNIHVDMVIAIEEQCLKDGYSVHEKARVAHSLADYCGIQKNSLYARCIKRRDEHKNGAPNLAFLPKSAVDGKGTSTISTSSSTKAINIASESSLTTKTAGTTTPIVAASKSTIISANPVTVSPSPTRSNSARISGTETTEQTEKGCSDVPPMPLPSTSVSSSSASSTVKASTAPVTSSIPTNTASNSDPSTSVKTSQSWTGQKKLAAQAMVTNLAALLPSSERLGDLQEVLRKVGNETMTYDDFLKWHDKSMKSVYARASVEKKNAVNGIARVSPSTSNVNKTTKCGSGASSELAVGTQCKNPTNVPSSLTKRVSLAQAVATAKIPPRGRPLSLTHVQISERLESDKQTTLQAIATAIDNSKVAYKKKCDVASATGKPAPRFDFLWTENLANALKVQIDLYWSVLLGSDSYAKLADNIFTVFAKEIFPYFRNEIKLSRLLIEYTRRNPEKAFILACPSAQKLLKDDNIDLSSIAVLAKKGKPVNDSVAAKTNPTTPYKPILPVRSSSFDEIQTTSSQDDPDVVVIEPSTSNATTSNDGAATASTPPSSSDAMSQVGAVLTQMGWSLPPAQLSELSFAMSNLTSITTDPHKLQALKEALLMQFASEYQLVSKKKQGAGKKKDGEDKKKTMEQEKEEKKRVKVERREELNAQKRVLAASAKEKAIEEKRLRLEEEKRQKLAEKARKEKEEREKRLEEQAERERLMREEREKLAKEAAEKQKKEEEERQRLEQTRIKIEQERAQELEKRRQAELREEERKAAQLLEQEIRMEEVSQSDVTPDLMLVFEEEEQAESKRLKKQEEQVAAVRAANLAAQAQRMHSTPASNATRITPSHNISMNATAEKKPQPMVTPKQQNTASVGYSVSQQSNMVRSPVTSVIHSSPQNANSSAYGLPSSHSGSCGATMSPQCMMSMTPPQRSPVVHQQQVVQSPQQYQSVQSPLSSGQQNTAVNRNPSVQAVQYSQPSSQHPSPTAFNQKGPSFMQPQSHESPHQNSYGFGMQQYQRQQQLHHQQQQQHQNQQQQHQRLQQQQQQQQREQQSHMQNQPVHRQPHVQQSIPLNQPMRQPPQSTLPQWSITEQPMQVQRQSQQLQQHRQSLHHQQIQLEQQQQSACVPGQYQNQMCQQQLTEQQRLMLQQQRVREMYMLQHQHQQLALQRQQQQQQFTMQTQDHRALPMLQQQSAYQNDARHHEMQQQHINQYAHHQPQDRDLFRY